MKLQQVNSFMLIYTFYIMQLKTAEDNSKKLHFQCYNILYSQGSALASCPWLLFGLPLGGEQSIEVCAAGVAWNMLHGENIS